MHDLRDLLPDARLDFRVPPDLPLVPADPRLLHHILLNLLTNAATHGAGKVTIAGERLPHGVRLSIADQGPGLPPGGADALFEAFARGTGSDSRGGSGLGLAIARSFAEVMNVRISASDREDGGAVFTLDFALGSGA